MLIDDSEGVLISSLSLFFNYMSEPQISIEDADSFAFGDWKTRYKIMNYVSDMRIVYSDT